ncbi:hypothetical protein [Brunnivagina elsteri]|uniref:hypothetical protein n=1 Tax=Brunnivagina elsteri TaxID=1247191 RepID=UPI001FE28457|nr:hypothetical protein [Calothrix elsteri]
MTNKELLIQEIDNLPPELLTEALNLIRSIKSIAGFSHAATPLEHLENKRG